MDLYLVQASPIHAAFGDELAGRDGVERLKHSRCEFGMVVEGLSVQD